VGIFSLNKYIFLILIVTHSFLFSQISKKIEVETIDGNIFLGEVIEENDLYFIIESDSGIKIEIPKETIKNYREIETVVIDGKVRRPDRNNSLYIFAPSAFPIEHNNSYCRNWCIFFPSYNRGFSNNFSFQVGGLIFPGMPLQDTPYIISGKFSLPKLGPASLSAGMMYLSMPSEAIDFGTGFVFGGGTIGNKFTHASLILGWGYFRNNSNWEFSEKPITVLASNIRMSDTFAFVSEFWITPEIDDISMIPLMASLRFIGRDISVDFGGFFMLGSIGESVPLPLLNFTYHFDSK
tara:strand:- start:1262 stop:2143 length:882 start_codon:yes stop_codon:yes gene_type:complete